MDRALSALSVTDAVYPLGDLPVALLPLVPAIDVDPPIVLDDEVTVLDEVGHMAGSSL
jgi:hypothetical protein